MYYVIKRQINNPQSCFLGFQVSKYIASKKNDNVIFEFITNGKIQRKWVKKDEIILLTDNKEFFIKTMNQFKAVQETQQKLVDEARDKLNQSMQTYTQSVNAELDTFEEIRTSSDIPCILID